jgi:hypothetical protein
MRNGEISWLISIDILSRVIFSHYLLKSKIYKHHKLSIILIVLSLCIMSSIAFIALDEVDSQRWPYFLFLPIKFIIIPLEDVFNKILLTEKFMLAHILMFFRGIGVMIIFIILIPIFYFTNTFEFELTVLNNDENEKYSGAIKILLVILYVFLLSFRSLSIMKVIYNFTPQHVSFINVVYYLFISLRCRFDIKDKPYIIIIDIICMAIIILSTLIFNEMLILKFCGLNQNTQVGFLAKEEKELKEMTSIENGNDDDDDDENDDDGKKKDNSEQKEEYHNV